MPPRKRKKKRGEKKWAEEALFKLGFPKERKKIFAGKAFSLFFSHFFGKRENLCVCGFKVVESLLSLLFIVAVVFLLPNLLFITSFAGGRS